MPQNLFGLSRLKLLLYILLIVAVSYGLFEIAEDFSTGHSFNQTSIEAFIASTGIYSYAVYTALVAFMVLTPIASSALWLIGGYLFNPFVAIALTILAETVGGIGNFYIGKTFISRLVNHGRWPKLASMINRYTGHINFLTIFMLGLIPVSTANVTAYAASLSGMPLWRYLVPWVSGMTILSTLTILLGYSASANSPWRAVVIIGTVIGLFLAARYVSRKYLGFGDPA